MSEATAALVDPTAALTVAPSTVQAVQASGQTQEPEQAPPWLPDRLKQARQTAQAELLTKFGGAKVEDIEAKLRRLKELEDATLSDKERNEKQIAELRVQAAEAERYRKLFGEQTQAELGSLTEEQRVAVLAFAGEDPVEQHRMVQAFRMAGAVKSQQAGALAPPPPPAPPATTVPAGTAPAPAPGVKPMSAQWAELRERDPIAGQFFYQQHAREING